MKITKETTIKEFMDYVWEIDDRGFQICDEARVWLKKIGINKPLKVAWDRCTNPTWMGWGLYLAMAKYDRNRDSLRRRMYFRKNLRALEPIRQIKRKFGMTWKGDQRWESYGRDDAKIIRAHFNPFKEGH